MKKLIVNLKKKIKHDTKLIWTFCFIKITGKEEEQKGKGKENENEKKSVNEKNLEELYLLKKGRIRRGNEYIITEKDLEGAIPYNFFVQFVDKAGNDNEKFVKINNLETVKKYTILTKNNISSYDTLSELNNEKEKMDKVNTRYYIFTNIELNFYKNQFLGLNYLKNGFFDPNFKITKNNNGLKYIACLVSLPTTNKYIESSFLIDTGAECCMISYEIANIFNLKGTPVTVSGIGIEDLEIVENIHLKTKFDNLYSCVDVLIGPKNILGINYIRQHVLHYEYNKYFYPLNKYFSTKIIKYSIIYSIFFLIARNWPFFSFKRYLIYIFIKKFIF